MAEYTKPLPVIEKWNAPYWQAAKRHEFVAQKCHVCSYVHLPPGPVCTNCLSDDQEWVRLSGKGTIYSYGIYYQLWHTGFKEDIPYNVALIQLAEGPQIISQVVGCKNEELDCGLEVEVVFDDVPPEITLPKFRLVGRNERE
ncbi:MAG: Zn-ribbon domain-containing OB-fold protein [Deltaproteobacteria bacterium]|nr:Zn-ribbon domain-containing OB-fold protein [Deltaproteobacteria bacterium]